METFICFSMLLVATASEHGRVDDASVALQLNLRRTGEKEGYTSTVGAVDSPDEVIRYNGLKAEANWSLENDIFEEAEGGFMEQPSDEFLFHPRVITGDMIPVYAFESTLQMRRMVLDWGRLHEYNVSLAMHGSKDTWADMSKAFEAIEASRPPVAVWLLEYKDGKADTLDKLAKSFGQTRNFTRHIVFHWSPEFCDQGSATFQRIKQAYEHVDTVFQFGYQDERLASLDKNKFKPWPLGAATWKNWKQTASLLATEDREYLACFRGSKDTRRQDFDYLQALLANSSKVIIEDSGSWTPHDTDWSRKRYQLLLSTSMYVLNIPGHNPNCYRMAETIESGAIPVIAARKGLHKCYDNWSALYGHATGTQYDWIPKAPFEVLKNWEEIPNRLEVMSSLAKERGSALKVWYEQWRQSFIDAFASAILNQGQRSLSE